MECKPLSGTTIFKWAFIAKYEEPIIEAWIATL
jgi:hypothetical protein